MNKQDLYRQDPELSDQIEKWVKKRTQVEGVICGTYLTMASAFSAASAYRAETVFDDANGPKILTATSALALYSAYKGWESVKIARNMDTAEFAKGVLVAPLIATCLYVSTPDQNSDSFEAEKIEHRILENQDTPSDNIEPN